jgi:hypothetical protein
VEWPELLRRQGDMLRQFAVWREGGCVGLPPAAFTPSPAPGPVPPDLLEYATELVARTKAMESAIAGRLSTLRGTMGHPASMHNQYEQRPTPRYLDALG